MERIVGRTKHGEMTLDELASIQPGLGTVMLEYSRRYWIIYYACKKGNWDLALYELKELREIADVGMKTRPKWARELADFDDRYLKPLEEAMKAHDWAGFEKAYNAGMKGSDEVHRRLGFHYIRYRLPERAPDFLDINP